jgi:hypothetical protein
MTCCDHLKEEFLQAMIQRSFATDGALMLTDKNWMIGAHRCPIGGLFFFIPSRLLRVFAFAVSAITNRPYHSNPSYCNNQYRVATYFSHSQINQGAFQWPFVLQ